MKSIIIRVSDGKIGHDRQSIGLCQALSKIDGRKVVEIKALPFAEVLYYLFSTRRAEWDNCIIVGAGHKTHLTLLAYKIKHKIKSIVIMKPSFPKCWFDLCIIPRHDNLREKDNVVISNGAINDIIPENIHDKINSILILIGGESRHVVWCNDNIYSQLIDALKSVNSDIVITLTTSRRTPASFLQKLPDQLVNRFHIVPFEIADSQWLSDQLYESSDAWVTSDSVSMIYEALTAKCRVNLLTLTGLKGKIAQNIDYLLERKWVTLLDSFSENDINEAPISLNEAKRIATIVKQRGF